MNFPQFLSALSKTRDRGWRYDENGSIVDRYGLLPVQVLAPRGKTVAGAAERLFSSERLLSLAVTAGEAPRLERRFQLTFQKCCFEYGQYNRKTAIVQSEWSSILSARGQIRKVLNLGEDPAELSGHLTPTEGG